jgi:hypothetical protein
VAKTSFRARPPGKRNLRLLSDFPNPVNRLKCESASIIISIMVATTYAINPSLAWRVIDEEIVILKISTTTYYSLDPVGAFIWRRMEGAPKTRRELVSDVLAHFEAESATVEKDLDELLTDLVREELLLEQAAGPHEP